MIYLTEKQNLPEDIAKDVYGLYGGRLKSLQNAASKIESGVPFSSMLKSYYLFSKKNS
jgi:hypothetical protein